jgi:quercetin dioxygenase-like cupin family protein
MPYSLRLIEDVLVPGARHEAAARPLARVVYLLDGTVEALESDRARLASGAITAGAKGARLLRWELVRQPPPPAGGRVLLEHPLGLDAKAAWLIRCDRVDFERGAVAPTHGHQGGGIRCLLHGRLEVKVGDGIPRTMRPGDAWFESGQEPVRAVAAKDEDTSFIRVAILPAAIRGKTSILYVDPAAGARSKPRTYTVFVDEPIAI